jgi:hypothetical protein
MRETARFVYLSADEWAKLALLAELADDARRRQEKAAFGDRREAIRFAGLCTEIERAAWRCVQTGAPMVITAPDSEPAAGMPWITSPQDLRQRGGSSTAPLKRLLERGGGAVVEVRDAFGRGPALAPLASQPEWEPPPPAEVWRGPSGARGRAADEARWLAQLHAAATDGSAPIVPSGIGNRVITEGLRQFAARSRDCQDRPARVVYRDGSEADPFPLSAVNLVEHEGMSGVRRLRLALISMRHPEMDADVDGCWFRNRDVSQSRPSADTDRFATKSSREQLTCLAAEGPMVIEMYQTGLEPAVVGFYRALATHLKRSPGSVVVVPRYFDRDRPDDYSRGTTWASPK